MKYDDRIIDQVQMASDIVEVIGQSLTLKRSGRNLKGLCPFHSEKTPSFMVNPEKQIYHCFGCGAGGDVFSFLMKNENMSFGEAIRFLAEKANIVLPEAQYRKQEGPSESEQLYDIYKHACEYYHQLFMDPVRGKVAREYFIKRGFDMKLAEEFKMGWALDGWQGLLDFLRKKGFPEALLLKSALAMKSSKGTLYDTFRARLLFPIANLQGKIVAFGGRTFKEGEGPKYLNSPENPVFQKRRELFGLYLAKKHINREKPQIFVTEGYFDFMRLYQYGFKSAVATLGTSLTEEHVFVMKRFAEEAVVVYDGDKAGEAAALRGLEVFLEGGMNVKIARVPTGYDPDDFILKHGAEAFQKILDEARDFFDYKLEILMARFNRLDSLGLMKITSDFLETFSKIQNPILTDRYLRKLAASLGVDENSLRAELLKLKKKHEKPSSGKTEVSQTAPKINAGKIVKWPASDEIMLVSLGIEETALRRKLLMACEEDDFEDAQCREILRLLMAWEAEKQASSWPKVLSRIQDPSFKQKLTAVSTLEWDSSQKEKAFEDCLNHLKSRKLDKKLEELRRSIAKAERDGNPSLMSEYVREYQTLWRESKARPAT